MKDELFAKFEKLETKISSLLEKFDVIKNENIELNKQISKLKEEKVLQNKEVKNPIQQTLLNQASLNFDKNGPDSSKVKKEIELAVKGIDECIEWLQKY